MGHSLSPEEQLAAGLFEAMSLHGNVGGILGLRMHVVLGKDASGGGAHVGVMSEHGNLQEQTGAGSC